jgi:hypothetical protein
MKELEAKSVALDNVTRSGLKEDILAALKESGLLKKRKENIEGETRSVNDVSHTPVHFWGGSYHLLPEDFDFPAVSVRDAWQLWLIGDQNENRKYPSFRRITPKDLSTLNKRKRLCDFKYLMRIIERRAEALNLDIRRPSPVQAREIFDVARLLKSPQKQIQIEKGEEDRLFGLLLSAF